MRIEPAQALSAAAASPDGIRPGWKPGQVLPVRVIGLLEQNFTRLLIGGTQVDARTTLPLRPGETFAVTVQRVSPTVVLKAERAPPANAPGSVERALARALPRQASLPQMLSALRTLASTVAAARPGPADAATGATRALLQPLPASTSLAAPAPLRAAVLDAARPTEARLAGAGRAAVTPALAGDLRVALEAVVRALPQTARDGTAPSAPRPAPPGSDAGARSALRGAAAAPPAEATRTPTLPTTGVDPARSALPPASRETIAAPARPAAPAPPVVHTDPAPTAEPRLRELLEGAIARVRTQQLASLPQPQLGQLPLLVDLPVQHRDRVDVWHFEFEREARPATTPDEDGAAVTITLQLSPEVAVRARVGIRGDSVRARLDSDDPRLRASLATRLDALGARFRQRGLDVGGLSVGALPSARGGDIARRTLIVEAV